MLTPDLMPADARLAVPPPSAIPRRTLLSEQLLRGQEEVLVVHQGQTYRLRATRSGKLILTK